MTDQTGHTERSQQPYARLAGLAYLLTFLTGLPAFFLRSKLGVVLGLIAGACYIVVTLLFYVLFKPVNKGLSLIAAIVSLVGCAFGPVTALLHLDAHINPLVFFGFYCVLIGFLIFRSSFLPSILGALMAFAGLGWLTFLSPQLGNSLSPYNLVPGLLGEGALTVWLLVVGVNAQRWKEQASRVRE